MPNNDNRRRFGRDRSYINMSGKVGGKNYELIDVENLKEANKQMVEMIRHQQEFIDKQDERIRNQEEISEQEREYYRNNKKNIEDMTRRMEENNKVITGWNRNIRSNIINNPNKDNILDSLINRSANNQRVPRTITDLLRHQMQKNNRKEVDEIYNKAVKSVVNSYKRKGADFSDPAVMNRVNRDIQDKVLANNEFNKITKKFGTKAELFNVAVGTFKEAVGVWSRIFNDGIQKQSRVYNDTFENISVRNGTTRSQYYNAQIGLQGQLSSAGVFNNIASSEVMSMWNTLANNGVKVDLSNAEQTARAIETVITQHIVPYLDTTSKEFTILSNRLGDKFIKDIRGINAYNMEVAGNSYLTGDLLKEIIDQVQPMSDEALQNLTQGSAEFSALINMLTPYMGEKGAKEYATQIYKMQNYSDQVARSGSVFEKDWLFRTMNSGLNVYEPLDYNNIAGLGVDIGQQYASWLPGYTSTTNGLITNVGLHGLGLTTEQAMGSYNLSANGLSGSGLASKTDMTTSEWADYVRKQTQNFTNDQNQTNKKLQDVTVENLANEFAFLDEWLGNWAQVIKKAVDGIGLLISAKIVGGVIGKGMGMLTGQNGLALPKLGGIASTIGTVLTNPLTWLIGGLAVTVGGIYAITKSQGKKNAEGNASLPQRQNNAVEAYMSEGLKEDEAYFKALKDNTAIRGNIGVWNGEGEVAINPTTRAKLPNGQWYDKSVSVTDATDLVKTDALSAFDGIDDKTLKDEYGIELGWWFWEKDKTMKAREKLNEQLGLGKAADPTIYNKIKAAALLNILNNNSDKMNYGDVAAALNLMMYYKNKAQDKYITEAMDFLSIRNYATSKDKLKMMLDNLGITEIQRIKNAYKLLEDKQVDFYLMDSGRNFFEYPDKDADYEKMKADFNLHRYGLASVPYDEYPALLHQGEAVLTATTAAELRNLLEEYRQTSQQSINFDNIIQRQTSALVNKIDEVIKTIEHNKIGTFSNTDSMHKSRELLADSMRYMKSTKSF